MTANRSSNSKESIEATMPTRLGNAFRIVCAAANVMTKSTPLFSITL